MLSETGVVGLTVIFIVLIFYEFVAKTKRKFAIWTCTIALLLFVSLFENWSTKEDILEYFNINTYQYYLLVLSVHWIILKCTSYFIDVIDSVVQQDFGTGLAYNLYLPSFFFGPFLTYTNFKETYDYNSYDHLKFRSRNLILMVLRYGQWLMFIEILLHFLYVNAVNYQTEVSLRII